ncbi:MAG TPA: hypothetical protein VFN74_00540 [Chloroflexota bacterium]|nr:hypothetical protein [Chloroflexota bacterium]
MYSEVDDVIAPIFTELQPIVEARATAVGVARRVLDALSERGAELSQIPALTTDGQWQQAAVG